MSGTVNKVILIGHLGRDPETRTMQSGDIVVNLSVATSESWKDKATGEKKERTEWHRVVIFNQGIAKIAERYLKKGAKIFIEGQLETRKWTDKDGAEKYVTEILLRPFRGELTMLSTSGRDGPPPNENFDRDGATAAHATPPAAGGGFADEIPF